MVLSKNHLHDTKGERKKQILILVDKNTGKKTGTATREECHRGEGRPHLAFMAFILDNDGKIILAKRADKKSLWAGFWDAAVVSHVLPGETPVLSAVRRAKEEMGVEMEFCDLGAFYYFANHGENGSENEYCHVLIGKTEKEVCPNPVEVSKIRKISLKTLKEEITKSPGLFPPWFLLSMEKFDLSKKI